MRYDKLNASWSGTLAFVLPGINYDPRFYDIFQNAEYAANACKRNIEMTPLCKVEVTLPRVLGSRGCAVAVLSMSKQEFSRLDVLFGFSRVVCVSVTPVR